MFRNTRDSGQKLFSFRDSGTKFESSKAEFEILTHSGSEYVTNNIVSPAILGLRDDLNNYSRTDY